MSSGNTNTKKYVSTASIHSNGKATPLILTSKKNKPKTSKTPNNQLMLDSLSWAGTIAVIPVIPAVLPDKSTGPSKTPVDLTSNGNDESPVSNSTKMFDVMNNILSSKKKARKDEDTIVNTGSTIATWTKDIVEIMEDADVDVSKGGADASANNEMVME